MEKLQMFFLIDTSLNIFYFIFIVNQSIKVNGLPVSI